MAPNAVRRAGAQDAVATERADPDGDRSIDLGVAVGLLDHALRSGPPPVPFVPGAGESLLADTGQRKCYAVVDDRGWAEVPCDDPAACLGRDGTCETGSPNEGPAAAWDAGFGSGDVGEDVDKDRACRVRAVRTPT
jgi:hypothetical protein